MAERIDYQDYSEYDRTDAGASAGVDAYLSTMCSLRMKGFGRVRRYDNDPDRDGTVAGGATILRQRLGRDLRLSQSAEYESSRAAYDGFSYRGPAFRFGADYALSKQMLVAAGYGFQSQQYRDSSATTLRTRTASLGTIYDLTRRWSTLLAYDRQVTKAGTSDVITRNNILSLAVRWAY
jgi:long-subunit fatty acid transport protein